MPARSSAPTRQVNATIAGDQHAASVIGLADGGFIVAWEDDDAGVTRAQRFDAAGDALGSEFDVFAGVGGGAAHMALLNDGRVAFSIDRLQGGDWDVVSAIFDPRTGDSTPEGTPGNDALTALSQGSRLSGLGGKDVLTGLDGNDRLDGGGGKDTLFGGSGFDRLSGGRGADHLTGGGGGDAFVFLAVAESRHGKGRDHVEDFTDADGDHIDLSAIDANTRRAGNQDFHFVDGNLTQSFAAYHNHHAKGQWAGALRVSGHNVVQGDVNGDGKRRLRDRRARRSSDQSPIFSSDPRLCSAACWSDWNASSATGKVNSLRCPSHFRAGGLIAC